MCIAFFLNRHRRSFLTGMWSRLLSLTHTLKLQAATGPVLPVGAGTSGNMFEFSLLLLLTMATIV